MYIHTHTLLSNIEEISNDFRVGYIDWLIVLEWMLMSTRIKQTGDMGFTLWATPLALLTLSLASTTI